MPYLDYTNDDIINLTPTVYSLAGLMRALGLRPAGGNYNTFKKKIIELNLDTSHFTNQGWSKGKQLKDLNQYSRSKHIKKHLIIERGHKCEICALSEWLNAPIMLELHHIDGDKNNNEKYNLQLLCPNCHSTTDNWRNRKRSYKMASTQGIEPCTF